MPAQDKPFDIHLMDISGGPGSLKEVAVPAKCERNAYELED